MTSAFIEALPPALGVQAGLLRRLLQEVEADERWEWLELGCSVAAGRADELSDLDLALGHRDPAPPTGEVTALLRRLGKVVEIAAAPWEGMPRWWAVYADGGEIDLIVLPAERFQGRAPAAVVLLDRDGRLTREVFPRQWRARSEEPRQWLLDGWEALAGAAKHLHRGSVHEALASLDRARERALQLWAVAEDVDYPAFGLTSLLDAVPPRLPPGLDLTRARADTTETRAAGLVLADLLAQAGRRAGAGETGLQPWVLARLAQPTGSSATS